MVRSRPHCASGLAQRDIEWPAALQSERQRRARDADVSRPLAKGSGVSVECQMPTNLASQRRPDLVRISPCIALGARRDEVFTAIVFSVVIDVINVQVTPGDDSAAPVATKWSLTMVIVVHHPMLILPGRTAPFCQRMLRSVKQQVTTYMPCDFWHFMSPCALISTHSHVMLFAERGAAGAHLHVTTGHGAEIMVRSCIGCAD